MGSRGDPYGGDLSSNPYGASLRGGEGARRVGLGKQLPFGKEGWQLNEAEHVPARLSHSDVPMAPVALQLETAIDARGHGVARRVQE